MKTLFSWLKKRIVLILVLCITFFSISLSSQQVLAGSPIPEQKTQKAEQAADKIVQDEQKDTTKDIFGQYEESNEMIDTAREKASEKLKTMADKAEAGGHSSESLPPGQKNFLKKL